MKPHRILKTFKGTQDGLHDHEEFVAGTVAHLSKGLATIVTKEGWADAALATDSMAPARNRRRLRNARVRSRSKAMPAGTEEKSEGAAPENKMKKAAPENKKAKK